MGEAPAEGQRPLKGTARGASSRSPRPGKRRAKGDDPELRAGTSAHYEDPAYYAKTYDPRRDDVRYYVELAEAHGGPVLEYGCGNGRIALPLARAGHSVLGVDLSAPMLASLRDRLGGEPPEVKERVRVRRGDMRALRLGERFPLVLCPFNAFLHLYERRDVERFLARVREHLTPDGLFAFDVSVPDPEELARDPRRAHGVPPFRYPGGPVVRYAERFDYDKLRQILFVSMEFSPTDGSEKWMTPLAHRQFCPQELEALLHYNGFESRFFDDFSGDPADRETWTLVVHARIAKDAGRRAPMKCG